MFYKVAVRWMVRMFKMSLCFILQIDDYNLCSLVNDRVKSLQKDGR